METILPARLRRLPRHEPIEDIRVFVAAGPRARLLGLAGLAGIPCDTGLLLPHTNAVHTFWMRFALDLLWLDAEHRVIRVDRSVPPRRFRACRSAWAVLEVAAPPNVPRHRP